MKKLAIMALALFSGSVLAVTENVSIEPSSVVKPLVELFVLDVSGKEMKLMKSTQLSRSKPRNLCIAISNVEIYDQNRLVEYFVSPAPMVMTSPGSEIQVDENKKGFLVITPLKKSDIKNNVASKCWKFDEKDPIGKYKLDVQFNNIVFKGLSFEVLK
ncbi:hypothetical protein [Lonepinella sp. BR2357]|uniref:hypothetical protein n=1 Tax=Lonepinella sp. BR2357 TaxID=3434549 RepID=UPI003F6DDA5A